MDYLISFHLLNHACQRRNQLLLAGYQTLQLVGVAVIRQLEGFLHQGVGIGTVAQKLCRLLDDIGEHEENHVQAAFPVRHRQVGNQLLADLSSSTAFMELI